VIYLEKDRFGLKETKKARQFAVALLFETQWVALKKWIHFTSL
jgi:hypothetical protein